MKNRYVAILAGGRGERFWPQSRVSRPKHLLNIVGKEPMLVQTLNRLKNTLLPQNTFIITHTEQKTSIHQICPEVAVSHIIEEPLPKDTAAAISLASALAYHQNPEAVLAILPADHAIHNHAGFTKTLCYAFELAESTQDLITLGINPHFPATGYGYIQKGQLIPNASSPTYKVLKFVEKPNRFQAQEYLDSGSYFWNAGMFIAKISVFIELFRKFSEPHFHFIQALQKLHFSPSTSSCPSSLESLYAALPKNSFDYAIAEKAPNIICLEAQFDWDDVGEWTSLFRHHTSDQQGNIIQGSAVLEDCKNNLIVNTDGHLTAMIGVQDLVVIHTADATLICPKDRTQELKKLISQIEKSEKASTLL